MKPIHLLVALTLSLPGIACAADNHNHGHDHKSLHGGIITEAKDMDFELVAKAELLQLHLRDHGKPVDISKASAKVTLLSGTEKQEVELKVVGDKFEAKGSFKVSAGTKAMVQVTLGGKSTVARFVLK